MAEVETKKHASQERFTNHLRPHALGFQEVWPKPSNEELVQFYNNQYFKGNNTLPVDERRKIRPITCLETEHVLSLADKTGTMLELGFGDGSFLYYFHTRGWQVTGVDWTLEAIGETYPELSDKLQVDDVYKAIDRFIAEGKTFDVIVCNNILEHVVDPVRLLENMNRMLSPDGLCRIVVPNDDSAFQNEIIRKQMAPPHYWLSLPAHLSYFNRESFVSTLNHSGLDVLELLGTFPVEMFLLNPHSNYKLDPAKGPAAHQARGLFQTYLHTQPMEAVVSFLKGCADVGIGRNLVAYCRKKPV